MQTRIDIKNWNHVFLLVGVPTFFMCFGICATYIKVSHQPSSLIMFLCEALCALIIFTFFSVLSKDSNTSSGELGTSDKYGEILTIPFAVLIIIATAIIQLIHLWFISCFIDFSEVKNINVERLFWIFNTSGVTITAVTGWFFLAILTYLIALAIGSDSAFSLFFKIVGVAQIGALIAGACLMVYSFMTLQYIQSLSEISNWLKDSKERIIITKFGEYSSLFLLCQFLISTEKLKPSKSIFIAFIPTLAVQGITSLLRLSL